MPKIRTGTIPFAAGAQSRPHLITVKDAITDVMLRLTGELVVAVDVIALAEDDILRLVRRLQVTLDGMPLKIIGDSSIYGAAFKLLHYFNQIQFGTLPEYVPPGTAIATHAFSATVRIPFSMPERLAVGLGEGRHLSSLQIEARELEIVVDWGVVADVGTPAGAGTAALQNVAIEVIAITDPSYNDLDERMILQEATQNLAVTAGANTNEQVPLNKSGLVPYIMLLGLDTSCRNDAVWNRLTFNRNTTNRELDMSWEAMRSATKDAGGLQGATLPTGVAMALFDEDKDGGGFLDVGDSEETSGWDLVVDHDALGAEFRLFAHHYALIED